MKKMTRVLALVLLVAAAATLLVSCTKYPSLKKAFEKEGYKENTALESVSTKIKEELEKDDLTVNLHLLTKESNGITSVLIIEFKATEDMKKAYDDSSTIQGFVKDISKNEDAQAFAEALENAGYAKGNCLVVPLSPLGLHINEITNIVKSVK